MTQNEASLSGKREIVIFKTIFFKTFIFEKNLRMTEVRKRIGKKDEKSIKSEKSNVPENDSKSKFVQIGKNQSFNVLRIQNRSKFQGG